LIEKALELLLLLHEELYLEVLLLLHVLHHLLELLFHVILLLYLLPLLQFNLLLSQLCVKLLGFLVSSIEVDGILVSRQLIGGVLMTNKVLDVFWLILNQTLSLYLCPH
jgi:hypothetical protein